MPEPTIMDALDDIIAHGNRGFASAYKSNNHLICKDGYQLSVIAGGGTYCSPRPHLCFGSAPNHEALELPLIGECSCDYPGPYSAVEVGIGYGDNDTSGRPEPWRCSAWSAGYDRHADHTDRGGCDGWCTFYEGDDDGDGHGIYAYVPVAMVRALVDLHGGLA